MANPKKNPKPRACPCGLGAFEACCARYISGDQVAPTAQALVRSRYSAYVLANEAYLRQTWHTNTCPTGQLVDNNGVKWLGLDVRGFECETDSKTATVEFVARYKVNGRAERLHEISTFVFENERWLYVTGTVFQL